MSAAGLELHALRRSFGELVAVDGLSFSVPVGHMVGFVGRNGAGKTTTMRIICGLLVPDAGHVTWQGGPIDGRVRERIGYMPEERGLYPKMRVGDQLEYFAVLHGAPHDKARAAAARGSGGSAWEIASGRGSMRSAWKPAAGSARGSARARPDLLILMSRLPDSIRSPRRDGRRAARAGRARRRDGFSSHQLELVQRL